MAPGRTRPAHCVCVAAIVLWGSVLLASANNDGCSSQPNLFLIIIDDWGYGDVGYNNALMPTPNLDQLAKGGIILDQLYSYPTCSPSRGALLTGKYSHHIGLQHNTIDNTHPYCLSTNNTLLPQALKNLGYDTYMAGKWHLGFCKWDCTPTYCGFDEFDGYYSAAEDYYTHMQKGGFDFRHNTEVDKTVIGQYSTNVLVDRTIGVINKHNCSKPLFVELAFQALHGPLQVPPEYPNNSCSHILDADRKSKCLMLTGVDIGVGRVINALQQKGMINNTLVVVQSDNGGPVPEAGSNWPLRGSKSTIWEGGVRVAGFVYAPGMLQRINFRYKGLIHIVDWYKTFVQAGGGTPDSGSDGISQWDNLRSGEASPRTEFPYNLDDKTGVGAYRYGPYKLIQGWPGKPSDWYASPEIVDAGLGNTIYSEDATTAPREMLFNLDEDPEEKHNLLENLTTQVQELRDKIVRKMKKEAKTGIPTEILPKVKESDPKYYGGAWSPGWC